MDFNNFIESIYNMAVGLIEVIGVVWNWLSDPLKIDIPLLRNIPLVGGWFNISLNYSPLEFIGVGILVLLILWIIKSLIPLG